MGHGVFEDCGEEFGGEVGDVGHAMLCYATLRYAVHLFMEINGGRQRDMEVGKSCFAKRWGLPGVQFALRFALRPRPRSGYTCT